jgi:hypothetical protein
VVTDVAHELAGQVPDRSEDPTGNYIALDPGKPVFDLIEPGGVGRREVQMDFGVGSNKLFHPAGLMSREIVRDQMNLLAMWLIGDQVRAPASASRVALNLIFL